MDKKPNKKDFNDYVADIIQAGLLGDSGKVELISLTLARDIKNSMPDIASRINQLVTSFSISGGAKLRSAGNAPLPIDQESQLEVASIFTPDSSAYKEPLLGQIAEDRIKSFLEERNNMNLLLENGIRPSTSLLLIGQPGTGKTMLARYIASSLNKNLVVLDLSASISSLMGKTGANLKKVIQYAKQNSSVLLFDEFDAIAKKRNDNTDLGEIKRIVNVLLMELEDWPVSSILIATSNHPELLDRAIWRRFDHTISMNVPEKKQRLELLYEGLIDFFSDENEAILEPISELLEGKSAADILKLTNNIKRRIVLRQESPMVASLHELEAYTSDKKIRGKFCVLAKRLLGDKITVRQIAEITGLSPAGVQHHLTKEKL